jgi:hypothetical protein
MALIVLVQRCGRRTMWMISTRIVAIADIVCICRP